MVIIMFLLLSKYSFAQFSIGFSTGGNFCKFKQKTDFESNPSIIQPEKQNNLIKSGFYLGIPIEIGCTKRFSITSTFTYLQKGTREKSTTYKNENTKVELNGKTTYNYLELPLQFKYCFINHKIKAYLLWGTCVGYMMKVKTRDEYSVTDEQLEETYAYSTVSNIKSKDLENNGFTRFDFNLNIGTGVSYNLSTGRLFCNLSYYHGFINVINDNFIDNNGVTQFNRSISATIGYLVPLTKKE